VARAPKADVVHLDTHIVCWLYEGRTDLLSAVARDAIERGQLIASPIVDLELQLLYEIGRIVKGPQTVLATLTREIGLQIAAPPFLEAVVAARELNWTRDPFDRLIVAGAALVTAKLVTKDRMIRRHYLDALW
jgi:PIN domain nuclease of toxin-antitoxin system